MNKEVTKALAEQNPNIPSWRRRSGKVVIAPKRAEPDQLERRQNMVEERRAKARTNKEEISK